MARDHDLWLPDWDVRIIEYNGQEWPDVLVEKWEQNGIGERRLAATLVYRAPSDAQTAVSVDLGDTSGWPPSPDPRSE